jgi:hypothetical protein
MIGSFAGMALLYMVFVKTVPIISVWELKVGLRETSTVRGTVPIITTPLQLPLSDESAQ